MSCCILTAAWRGTSRRARWRQDALSRKGNVIKLSPDGLVASTTAAQSSLAVAEGLRMFIDSRGMHA